jgi:hypothetical protein
VPFGRNIARGLSFRTVDSEVGRGGLLPMEIARLKEDVGIIEEWNHKTRVVRS